MDSVLRKALEKRGLPPQSSDGDARDFYAHLPNDEKAKVGVEAAVRGVHREVEPLSVRNDPAEFARRDLTTRGFQIRAATVNEEERSVEAVISTDAPVEVFDWRRGETIAEILLAPAAQLPAQMPMLANHDRWSLDGVLGSIRNLRVEGGAIIGRLFFARDDQDADKAWNKVRQSHIVDVSVGYRVNESVEIAPGQTASVAGRQFTAGRLALRVVTAWTPREASLVPIGADQAAKIRDDQTTIFHRKHRKEGFAVNPKLRAFLETLGLRREATDAEAQTFHDNLSAADKARAAAAIADPPAPPEPTRNDPPAPPEPTRNDPPAPPANPPQPADAAAAARQAVEAERNRVRSIRELGGEDVPAEIVSRAIDDGWDMERANREFLTALRQSRGESVGPAVHVRSRERDVNARSLACALLVQTGSDPTRCRSFDTMREDAGQPFTAEDADLGDRIRGLSAPDLFRECVRHDTGQNYRTIDEALARVRNDRQQGRAATSGGTLSYVFGTNLYAKLIEGWSTVGDSTVGWCDEEDVPNFLPQEEITFDVNGRPDMHAAGETAKHVSMSDKHETYRAYRFTKQAAIDEMDIINDRLGALMKLPFRMGQAFAKMRPNIVFSLLLSNPTLLKTGKAVFHSDNGNLGTGALAGPSLAAALTAMASQRDANEEVLDIKARYLIVPAALSWTAATLLNSVSLAKTHATKSDPDYVPVNPVGPTIIKQVNGETLTLVVDDRIGATGCWNPMTKKMQTGSATNWFLTSGPLNGVRVLYRRGTNRQPVMRSYALDKGQWGVGWDMLIDIGGMIPDYRGLYKSTGAVGG